MAKLKIFSNGLRLVTHELPSTQAVTVLILAGAGSRYETKKLNGISHFLEHMFFKGAEKFKSAQEVSEAIDSVGGEFNAFTGKEYVGYFVKVASAKRLVAMQVLSDMLLHARFDPADIDRERGVIMEEYNMYQDTPMYQVGWDFEKLLFGDQPMGWDQVGTKEFIHSVTHEDFAKYKADLYVPGNLVISIAGNITHEEACAEVERLFVFEKGEKAYSYPPLENVTGDSRVHLQLKKTEQAHFVIGFPAYPESHKDHYVLKVLSVILGGGMSSRMFQSVREQRGLSYYISTSTDDYMDAGVISTRAGVDVKRAPEAVKAIVEEYSRIRGEVVPERELSKAKEYLKGKLALKLEDSEEYAHFIGKYQLLHEKVMTIEEIGAAIDAVTAQDVVRVTNELFVVDKLCLAAIGPYEDKEEFEELLRF